MASPTAHHDGWLSHIINPYVLYGVAGFTGVIWFLAFNTQTFTDGVGMLTHENAPHTVTFPFWIWDQIGLLASEGTPDVLRMAVIAAFFVSAVQISVSLGIGVALQIVQSRSGINLTPALAKEAMIRNFLFVAAALVIFGIDTVFNWGYGPGDLGAHALFSLAVWFCSFFFLPMTFICVKAGLELQRP